MKKILLGLTILLTMVLGACDSAPEPIIETYDDELLQTQITEIEAQLNILENYDDDNLQSLILDLETELAILELALSGLIIPTEYDDTLLIATDIEMQNRLDELDITIDELEQILINLEVIEGLNGQKEYYIANTQTDPHTMSYELMGDELDKSKAPSYVLDNDGNYVPFDDVADKLLTKYYGTFELYRTFQGAQVGFNIDVDITKEEFIARTILLIEELSHYDFYIISSSQIYIQVNCYGVTSWITIPIATLRSSFITLNADVMIDGLYEVKYAQLTFNSVQVKAYYDQYVLDETYSGYVLNYN